MSEVEEYRIKIEAIQERLKSSNGEGEDEVQDLKDRLGSVRDAMQSRQETIDSQSSEIAALREENGQLSAMLGQALAALEVQNQGGIKEIVESIDSEFADLLTGGEAEAEQAEAEQAEADEDGGRREPATTDAENQDSSSEGPKWDPENESAPALQRIVGRRKR